MVTQDPNESDLESAEEENIEEEALKLSNQLAHNGNNVFDEVL